MILKSYEYSDQIDTNQGWKMQKVEFGSLNMIVGISGSGKTRLFNTITNLGLVATKKTSKSGSWKISAETDGSKYEWELVILPEENGEVKVQYEKIIIEKDGKKEEILNRNKDELFFLNNKLPKLPRETPSVALLKEEEIIQPLFKGFESFVRRDFTGSDLKESAEKHLLNFNQKEELKKNKNLKPLIKLESLNDRLDILNHAFKEVFDKICGFYMEIFPFIKRIDVKNIDTPFGKIPVFVIKERNVNDWIPLNQLSSGMQKILFILTDICSLPEGSVLFIDEYENSLGINAINSIPQMLFEYKDKIQVFLTSHHPYLINNVPVSNWYLVYREGQNVKIKYGNELVERYGTSKQKAFINLINDTLYSEGVE